MSTLSELISGLPTGNIGNATVMLLDTTSSVIGYYTQETFGKAAGDYVKNCINDTLMGAIVGGIPGAAVGALNGIIRTALVEKQENDNQFRSFISGSYEGILTNRSNMTENGLRLLNLPYEERENNPNVDQLALAKAKGYERGYNLIINNEPGWKERFSSEKGKTLMSMFRYQGEEEGKEAAKRDITIWKAMENAIPDGLNADAFLAFPNEGKINILQNIELAKYNAESEFKRKSQENTNDISLIQKQQKEFYNKQNIYNHESKLEQTLNMSPDKFWPDLYNNESYKKLPQYLTGYTEPKNIRYIDNSLMPTEKIIKDIQITNNKVLKLVENPKAKPNLTMNFQISENDRTYAMQYAEQIMRQRKLVR